MGNILNRSRDDEVEDDSVDQSSNPHGNHGYLYHPRNGFYFGSHFIMGGEKFETGSPETYLFGDNLDLNFLGPKPIPFPYLAPLPDEPTRSLRVLVNIRKETLRFIKRPSKAYQTNQFSLSDISSNIIIPTINGNDSFTPVNSKKFPSNGSIGNIRLDHHELKEIPSSSNSTAVLPTTSSPQELSKSNASSSSSLNSPIKPAQTQYQQETNRLLEHSVPTETINPIITPVSSSNTSTSPSYNIEFTFDSDVKCSVTIYYLATEESTPSGNIYVPRDPTYKTETYHYPMGAGQTFSHPTLIFNPNSFNEDDLAYRAFDEYGNFDPTIPYPIVIQLNAEEGTEPRQSHSLIATCERNNEKQFYIKPFKQKIVIDGLSYLIQEVYGIENKNQVYSGSSNDKPAFYSSDEEIEDNGSECVICMSESRDTLILPCRHLCLCNACADSLRYQANNCPICRSPFKALLQFRAVRKTTNNAQSVTTINEINAVTRSSTEPLNTSSSSTNNNNQRSKHTSSARPATTSSTNQTNTGNLTPGDDTKNDIPSGYEAISLVEALNGPPLIHSSSRPGEFGLHAFQSSFDDEDVAPLASIEATTKSFSGSSQSMGATKSYRDRQSNHSSNSSSTDSNQHSRYHHVKSSFSSLADIRYPTPSSSSSLKLGNRSKSISKSKFSMIADTTIDQRSGGNGNSAGSGSRKAKKETETSSGSLTLWSQQETPDSVDDQEKVKLLDSHSNQQQSKYHPVKLSEPQPSSANKEPSSSKPRRNYRNRENTGNHSELKALNSSSSSSRESPSHHHEPETDSIGGIDINSINLTSTSYPDLFLLDGVDEQRFMDETDILSVTTVDSVPNENSQQTD